MDHQSDLVESPERDLVRSKKLLHLQHLDWFMVTNFESNVLDLPGRIDGTARICSGVINTITKNCLFAPFTFNLERDIVDQWTKLGKWVPQNTHLTDFLHTVSNCLSWPTSLHQEFTFQERSNILNSKCLAIACKSLRSSWARTAFTYEGDEPAQVGIKSCSPCCLSKMGYLSSINRHSGWAFYMNR